MGYSTDFDGEISIEPPLNEPERQYLIHFSLSRHVDHPNGPYDLGLIPEGRYNRPPTTVPGYYCQWVPGGLPFGSTLEWDGGEKFYNAAEWMAFLIDHFLKPGAIASTDGDTQFGGFTFDHILNGVIGAQGQDSDDFWALRVENNRVYVDEGKRIIVKSNTPIGDNQMSDIDPSIDHPITAEDHVAASAAWATGHRSYWNTYNLLTPDPAWNQAMCAIADAAKAQAHAAAAYALAAVR